MVLISITASPAPPPSATPPGPRMTASTSVELGRMVRTTSLACATSLGDAADFAPTVTRTSTRSLTTSYTVRGNPCFSTFLAMGPPMSPRPMKPTRFMPPRSAKARGDFDEGLGIEILVGHHRILDRADLDVEVGHLVEPFHDAAVLVVLEPLRRLVPAGGVVHLPHVVHGEVLILVVLLVEDLQRLSRLGEEELVGGDPAPDQLSERLAVLLVIVVTSGPTVDDGGRGEGPGVGEHLGLGRLRLDRHVERNPQGDGRHGSGDERGHRLRHALVDDLHVLGRVEIHALERLVEEIVRGGAARGGNFLALEVLDARDALVGRDPDLSHRPLEVVDQEHLALAARGEVGEYATRGQHVQAASHEGLEELHAGGELAELEVQSFLLVRAE